ILSQQPRINFYVMYPYSRYATIDKEEKIMNKVQIDSSWEIALHSEFTKPYWESLTANVRQAYQQQTVYPHPSNVFRAFNLCPFDQVKVVIVGQDPYHGPGQAIGLSFAVNEGIQLPPSLKN